ncbi:HAD family hydrolase [soil metagenome]
MLTNLLDGIRAVAFDAVGTVLDPEPRPSAVYYEIGCRHGSRLPLSFISNAFREAFAHQERQDQALLQATSEAREWERWQAIVAAVLHDVTDHDACFQELWQHFGQPANWKLAPDVDVLFRELRQRDLKVAIASNFDSRLRPVLAGFPESQHLHEIVISSEVGWKKPAPQFFAELARRLQCNPGEILFVGDHPNNDYEGASAAGMRAVLVDPGRKHIKSADQRVSSLSEILPD